MTKTRITLATGAALLGLAVAAGPASAYQVYPSASAVTPWPGGTPWTATSGAVQLQTAAGTTLATCTASNLAGVVDNSDGVALLKVAGPASGTGFTGCTVAGQPLWLTVLPTWTISAVGGLGGVSTPVSNVRFRTQCSMTTPPSVAEYNGTLQTDFTGTVAFTNAAATSTLALTKAGLLSKTPVSGSGCPILPGSMRLSVTYGVATVNGAPISATNNVTVKP